MSRSSCNVATGVLEWGAREGFFSRIGLTVNGTAVAAFVCGAMSPVIINVMGEIYLGELLLIQFAFLLLLLFGARPLLSLPAMGVFLQTAIIMLMGYLLSDLYRDAHPSQFLRGWAKIILVTLDFAALAIVCAHDRRSLWWFIFGMAAGGIVDLLLREVPISTVGGWKSGYSLPLASILACLCCFVPIRVAAFGFAMLGVVNMLMDFRIMGAICVLVAAVLWLRSTGGVRITGRRWLQIVGICVVAGGIAGGALMLTEDEYAARREQSNAGRGAGLSVAVWAISESPLVGYGSWPMDSKLVNLYQQQFEGAGGRPEPRRINSFVAHSQLLQGWVEGGVMGALFWMYYGYWLVRAIWYVAFRRRPDAYLPIFMFFLTYDLWHLFMSVFGGAMRFQIAIAVSVICICAAEMHVAKAAK